MKIRKSKISCNLAILPDLKTTDDMLCLLLKFIDVSHGNEIKFINLNKLALNRFNISRNANFV